MIKISKGQIESYYLPITILIYVILLSALDLKVFYALTNDIQKVYELLAGAIITLLATFAGIAVPLSINAAYRKADEQAKEKEQKRKQKRTLVFMLGLIWNELRINSTYLKEIERVYDFDRFYKARFDALVGGIWKQIVSLNNLTEHVKDSSYVASQNSGAVITYDNDDLINIINQAYEGISYFKFKMRMNLEDITLKNYASDSGYFRNISAREAHNHTETFKASLNEGKKDLRITINSVENAIDMVEKKLTALGVKADVEEVK